MFNLTASTRHLIEGFAGMSKAFHLMEKNDYYNNKIPDFLFLFPKSTAGANIVLHRDGNKFNILTCKSNKIISTQYLNGNVPKDRWFDFLVDIAEKSGVKKKVFKNLSAKEFASIALQKEGVSRNLLQKFAPEALDFSDVEGIQFGKVKIIGAEMFKKSGPIVAAVEKAVGILQSAGYGHLLYGDIFLTAGNALSSNTLADYNVNDDVIRIPVKLRENADSITKTVLHEFGHRQYYKFNKNNAAVEAKFSETAKVKNVWKNGTVFLNNKNMKTMKTVGYDFKRGGYVYYAVYESDPDQKQYEITQRYMDTANIYSSPNQDEPEKNPFKVSSYALTNQREFFAEIFAFGLRDKIKVLTDWLSEVTK